MLRNLTRLKQTTDLLPYTYTQSATKVPIPFRELYNTITESHPPHDGSTCANRLLGINVATATSPPLDEAWLESLRDTLILDIPEELADRDSPLGVVHRLFWMCKASYLQTCTSEKCTNHQKALQELIPSCKTWPGFESWVLQIAACVCSWRHIPGQFGLRSMVAVVCSMVTEVSAGRMHPNSSELSVHPEYAAWEESVFLTEVFAVLTWLNAITTGSLELIHPKPDPDATVGLFNKMVVDAFDRSEILGLCPQRVWAIAKALPRTELNLPGLIPTEDLAIWAHSNHENCGPDFCEESIKKFTSVDQLHVCSNRASCGSRTFDRELLDHAVRAGRPTAWKLDGQELIDATQSYMAISHVWADGTGVGAWPAGIVNRCLYDFFHDIARDLGCDGIWWDTICIPLAPELRGMAMNNMHNNYAGAKVTLVHDLYLRKFEWAEETSQRACFAVVMSTWFTRGWTALELMKSNVVKVLFKSSVVKDLDTDILARKGEPSSPSQQASTAAIVALRELKTISDLNKLLTAFGSRYTSWSRDRAIIAGLLVGVKDPNSCTQQEIYQNVLKKIGRISYPHLFHGLATMSKRSGFSWCPTNLLDLPIVSAAAREEYLTIERNGDVIGKWRVWCGRLSEELIMSYREDTHPLIRARIQLALQDSDKHVLLTEHRVENPTRGLVVRLMRKQVEVGGVPEVYGRLICPVQVRQRPGTPPFPYNVEADIEVRIGESLEMLELPDGEVACQYAKWAARERSRRAWAPYTPSFGIVHQRVVRPDGECCPLIIPTEPHVELEEVIMD